MQLLVLLLLATLSLQALELSVQSGKEAHHPFSLLHLRSDSRFLCQEKRNDLDEVTSITCAFDKRPIQPIKEIENDFFTIDSRQNATMFFISITPKKKILLYPQFFNLLNDKETFSAKDDYASHWVVVGYDETIPFIKDDAYGDKSINFPIQHDVTLHPFIGGLDMQGNPIKMTRIKDVSEYLVIKKYFEQKRYEEALASINELLTTYPDTIFRSELILYKIRCYHEKEDPEALISEAKQFIREYSSDVNIAEVLADIANAYAKIALFSDADYFFDRLFSEHPDSPFTHLGYIYKAQQLEASGSTTKAMEYYERALHLSRDRDTAAHAAFRLATLSMEQGNIKAAIDYVNKILQGYSEYFGNHYEQSRDMALDFASRMQFKTAADITGALLKTMERTDDTYEQLLRDQGMWLAETSDKEAALQAFNTYIEKYKFGTYIEEIQKQKDALFFDVNDDNASERLQRFDELMSTYAGDSIAQRAIYEKAKLLNEVGAYQKVLDMKSQLESLDPTLYTDIDNILATAAKHAIEAALQTKACAKVVELSRSYDSNLSHQWDAQLFECFVAAGSYDTAKTIAQEHLGSKNYDERVAWLERYIRIDFALGNYTAVIDATKELIALRDIPKQNGPMYRILFDAAQRLGEKETMLDAITTIEAVFGLNYDDIERYTQMVTVAKDLHDNVMIESFAKKVMQLQKRAQSFTQTPYIEFTLAQALMDNNKFSEALEVIKTLDTRSLKASQRARQKYLLGMLYQKLGKQALGRRAYEESISADANSSWGKLAADAKALLR